jgi:micrococcal nuclease
MYKQIIPFLIFLLVPLQALAWPGRAIHISDGDTITVLAEDKQQVRIRLYGIDAPEMRQNFGRKAKEFATGMVGNKMVILVDGKISEY